MSQNVKRKESFMQHSADFLTSEHFLKANHRSPVQPK